MREIILASTSTYRRALMERLGIPFRVVAPGVDESSHATLGLSPRQLAERLAAAKATARSQDAPQSIWIGSDQVVNFRGQALGKPGNPSAAIEQLLRLSGSSHDLITALAVWSDGVLRTHTDVSTLTMRSLERSALERYAQADSSWDCAGSYKLESRGIVLFESIRSDDHTAITGLPMIQLVTFLRELGVEMP